MITQLNKVELIGTVGCCRVQTTGGKRKADIALATNRAYKDADGNAVIETTWHKCTAFEGPYIQDIDRISKGTTLHLFGRIHRQCYINESGERRDTVEIIVSRLEVLDPETAVKYETNE